MSRQKILIVGATGVVGSAAVDLFAQDEDWEVTAIARRPAAHRNRVTYLSVDLGDSRRCSEIFGAMADVTHVVYAAVQEQAGGLAQGWHAPEQMQVNLAMLRNVFEPLERVARGLRHVTLLQGTKAYGAHLDSQRLPIPYRERWPRHSHENFYFLHEDYVRAKQAGKDWSWTIFRPNAILGGSLATNHSIFLAIGVYAAVRRELGLALSFPGGTADVVGDMTDADLLARAMRWAATSPASHNEIFNISNGDVFTWRGVWRAIADAHGMEVGPEESKLLAQEMAAHAPVWARIVRNHALAAPEDFRAFLGESFSLVDFALGGARSTNGAASVVSTIKLRQAGFVDCIDTEDALRKWYRRFQEMRLLPPA